MRVMTVPCSRLVLALTLLPLVACGAGSAADPARASVAAAAAASASVAAVADARACGGITVQVVRTVAGLATPAAKITVVGTEHDCEYRSIKRADSVVLVRVAPGVTSAAFAADRRQFVAQGVPTTAVAGLGATAYVGSATVGSSRTATALGWSAFGEVSVTVFGPVASGPSAAAMKATATTLLRTELFYAAGIGAAPTS
jgi:hypothetical protein